jgi:tRNA threonylcarbamoyladenosine biosynthesis protein TsaB
VEPGKTAPVKTVLAIVGCGPRLEVALAAPGMPAPALVALAGPTPRSDLIVAAIDLLLRSAGLDRDAIEAVVATRGPGSFTGIRVALATALGLAHARGIPAHGFSSLLVQAARTSVRPCLAVQPARRGHAYVQLFEAGGAPASAADGPAIVALADLASTTVPVVAPAGLVLPPETPVAPTSISAAEALLDLARSHSPLDADTLVPVYHEPAQAEVQAPLQSPWQRSHRAS